MKTKLPQRVLDQVSRHRDARRSSQALVTNLDAADSVFFLRELEKVKQRTADVVYPLLKARLFIPPETEKTPSGAATVTYSQYDRVGLAKIIASYAADFPRVDVKGLQFTSQIRSIGDSFGYNWQELRGAAFAGKDLSGMKARAARDVMEELIDSLLSLGSTADGINGAINNAAVTTSSISGADWATKAAADPADILDDVGAMIIDMLDLTNNVEQPDTLLLPVAQYALLKGTQLIDSDLSVLSWLRANYPEITIASWYRLKGAGAGSTHRAWLYKRDPTKLYSVIPQEFEMFDYQVQGMDYVVPCHARCGGTVYQYPLSAAYHDGI